MERLDLAAMREFLAARGVAQFKWPERIEFVRQLPVTNVGKIRKSSLRRDIAEKLASERAASAHGLVASRGIRSWMLKKEPANLNP